MTAAGRGARAPCRPIEGSDDAQGVPHRASRTVVKFEAHKWETAVWGCHLVCERNAHSHLNQPRGSVAMVKLSLLGDGGLGGSYLVSRALAEAKRLESLARSEGSEPNLPQHEPTLAELLGTPNENDAAMERFSHEHNLRHTPHLWGPQLLPPFAVCLMVMLFIFCSCLILAQFCYTRRRVDDGGLLPPPTSLRRMERDRMSLSKGPSERFATSPRRDSSVD